MVPLVAIGADVKVGSEVAPAEDWNPVDHRSRVGALAYVDVWQLAAFASLPVVQLNAGDLR